MNRIHWDKIENHKGFIAIEQQYKAGGDVYISHYKGSFVCQNSRWIYLILINRDYKPECKLLLDKRMITAYKLLPQKYHTSYQSKKAPTGLTVRKVIQEIIEKREPVSIYWKDQILFMGYIRELRRWCEFCQVNSNGNVDGTLVRDVRYIRALQWDAKK